MRNKKRGVREDLDNQQKAHTYQYENKNIYSGLNRQHPQEALENAKVVHISPFPVILSIHRLPGYCACSQGGFGKDGCDTAYDCDGHSDVS
jgi:hypothetical protein